MQSICSAVHKKIIIDIKYKHLQIRNWWIRVKATMHLVIFRQKNILSQREHFLFALNCKAPKFVSFDKVMDHWFAHQGTFSRLMQMEYTTITSKIAIA